MRTLLKNARNNLGNYISHIKDNMLRKMYEANVKSKIITAYDDCTAYPTQEKYDDLFVVVTELVTMATALHIMDEYDDYQPHIIIVAGESHRKRIHEFLQKMMGSNLKHIKTVEASWSQMSCLRNQNQ